ncbi:hypothetical protein C8J57DRAFT_1211562 [Mycena rebaudengoi]|nr:hypothetical protein C8J57DRAFT_1211562 [Mycena rebaudengoi]
MQESKVAANSTKRCGTYISDSSQNEVTAPPITVPKLLIQIWPLATTPLAAFIPNSVVRDVVSVFAFIYFGAFVMRLNLPDARIKQLGDIQDITEIHNIAVQKLEHNPHFMMELGLRMRQIEFSESALRSRTLSSKDIK